MPRILLILVLVAAGGYFGTKFYVQNKVTKNFDTMLVQMRPIVDATYGDLTVSVLGEIQVDRVTARIPRFNDRIDIDKLVVVTPGLGYMLRLSRGDARLDFPERLAIEVAGLRADVDSNLMHELAALRHGQLADDEPLSPADTCAGSHGFTPQTLRRLGYDKVVIDAHIGFETRADTLVLDVGTDIEDMYDVDVSLALGGLTNPSALARGIARPMLIEGRLDYVDRSLNSRVMKHCIEDYELSQDEVIAARLAAIQTLARDNDMQLDALILEPYTEFLRSKERFLLTSQPTSPVDLTTLHLYRPADVPHLLNLVAEAH